MIIFPRSIEMTYFKQGLFNVTVEFDDAVRQAEGHIPLLVGDPAQQIDGKIDRSANLNKTPRIMGGAPLRDWFQANCHVGDIVYVDLTSKSEIRITKTDPRSESGNG